MIEGSMDTLQTKVCKMGISGFQAIVLSLGDHISTELQQLYRFLSGCEEAWKARLNEEGRVFLQQAEGRLAALTETSQAAQELLLEAQSHLELQDSAAFLKVRWDGSPLEDWK